MPVPALGSEIADIARSVENMGEGVVTGGGRWLRITYKSDVPIAGFIVPLREGAQYNPLDMLRFDLPERWIATTVDIDLSVSPSWNAVPKDYRLTMASPAAETAPVVSQLQILPADATDTASAFVRHMTEPESFVISTYHYLRGYRILGTNALPILATVFALVCIALALWKRTMVFMPLVVLAFGAHLAYGARVDVDLVRLSAAHAQAWAADETYEEAGQTYAVARLIASQALLGDVRVATCFDSTDYTAKVLRYAVLPVPVQIGTTGDMVPTHVAVMNSIDWAYESGRLRCGAIDAPAVLLREFSDGSRLFSLTPES